MLNIGHFNTLRIIRFTDHGAILDGSGTDILMPRNYVTPDLHVGDEVRVFVYFDQSGKPVGTLEEPLAEVGQFAFLRVAWTNRYGAFMDWGLLKDLFVPFSEQRHKMVKDSYYLIYIYIDDRTGRIVGTAKVDRCLSADFPPYRSGQEVEIIVWKHTDLGFKVIVDGKYEGLIYRDEIFRQINVGHRQKAVVKAVRADGKIDIALQHSGWRLVDDVATLLLRELNKAEGFLPYGDHTPADEIYERFHVSKKAFKRAVGTLYKEHYILIADDGLHLAPND